MKYRNFLVLLLIVIFTACKSVKPITESGKLDATVTSKQLIKAHNKKEADFKTLQAKVKVEFVQGVKSQTHTVNLRIEKNKTIWISAKFAILRVKITPQKVSFYNKLDNTYFDGDFTLISELLGTKLNFKNLQNLLLGTALFDLDKKAYEADTYETSYVLKPYNQDPLFEIFYLINPSYFLMDSQQLAQPQEKRILQIDYQAYQDIDKQILPKNIKVIAVEDNEETIIDMELKAVSLNGDLRFPFRIPSGFKEIEVK